MKARQEDDVDEFITVRIKKSLADRIRVLAEKGERTMAGEIRLGLREHADRQEAS
jgi:hypothetical protein